MDRDDDRITEWVIIEESHRNQPIDTIPKNKYQYQMLNLRPFDDYKVKIIGKMSSGQIVAETVVLARITIFKHLNKDSHHKE